MLEDIKDALLRWHRAVLGPKHTAGQLLHALVDGIEI